MTHKLWCRNLTLRKVTEMRADDNITTLSLMWLTPQLLLLWIACIDASNCKTSRHHFFPRLSLQPVVAVLLPMLINFDSIAAHASREIANIPATGLVFKDYLKVSAFEDPKIKGITIYLSDFDRSITDKLSKDFFDDPSTSSLSCAQTGPVLASDIVAISKDKAGEEVFEESRNLFFKAIRVRRVYDESSNTMVYASYSTRFNSKDSNKSRYRSSICAVHIN